jgi:hypothetical protein
VQPGSSGQHWAAVDSGKEETTTTKPSEHCHNHQERNTTMTQQQSDDDDMRALAATLFAPDDKPDEPDEPEQRLSVPSEGTNPPTGLSAEQINRDYAKRLFDDEYDIINPQPAEEEPR